MSIWYSIASCLSLLCNSAGEAPVPLAFPRCIQYNKPYCNWTVKRSFCIDTTRDNIHHRTVCRHPRHPQKTLMWYDQVGLLSPAFVGENGYRYYSYRQSARLETILMLRALEVSIPEIKTFLSHRSAGELRRLLTEKIAGVEGQIRRLEEIRHALVRQQASWPGWKPCP
ncbi:MAG: MerR family transcriptional regulator [Evtepia gabavorous]